MTIARINLSPEEAAQLLDSLPGPRGFYEAAAEEFLRLQREPTASTQPPSPQAGAQEVKVRSATWDGDGELAGLVVDTPEETVELLPRVIVIGLREELAKAKRQSPAEPQGDAVEGAPLAQSPDNMLRLIWREPDGERRRVSTFIPLDRERCSPDVLAALAKRPRLTAYLYSEVDHRRSSYALELREKLAAYIEKEAEAVLAKAKEALANDEAVRARRLEDDAAVMRNDAAHCREADLDTPAPSEPEEGK